MFACLVGLRTFLLLLLQTDCWQANE